jgi:hypothetical protein
VARTGDERQQLKWFVFTVAFAVALFVGGILTFGEGVFLPIFALVPAAAAVAILRYRLYDIDRLISRTVFYTMLSLLLAAVYLGAVVLLRGLLVPVAGNSQLAVAGSTLAVAALFGPARRRIQSLVDRRFNRARYDAAQVAEAFAGRLRHQVDLDQLTGALLAAVHETVAPSNASVWLPSPGRRRNGSQRIR